ncbi:MAG TPA: SdiA-regulated domain-containing protein [Chitinophagaceae bacterium]|nr:SdiA-regulated domain-containing protein [Chitinophagaceae bacterium]
MRKMLLPFAILVMLSSTAQPPQFAQYTIENIPLPARLNDQVCISGMNYMNGKLYLASERCPVVFETDPVSGNLIKEISFQVPQDFEMEGMTSYRNKLYLVTEDVAALYELDATNGNIKAIETSIPLPPKSKHGDGMEGIAANDKNQKFYLLRERNEERTQTEIYTFAIDHSAADQSLKLVFESKIEIPLDNPQWRFSDICYDPVNNQLLCLKSFSKGKLRRQYLEAIDIDANGQLKEDTRRNIPVTRFSEISNEYKDQDYSMNLEGITLDEKGNIFIVSDNTSGKALCDKPAKEKTILLELKKQ